MSSISKLFEGMTQIAFPDACISCDRLLRDPALFCEACDALVIAISNVHCSRCAEPGLFTNSICPRCAIQPPPFSSTVALFEHEGAVAKAIHRMKYLDRPDIARSLGQLLGQKLASLPLARPFFLVPVPIHPMRFRDRKFDQSTLIATEAARLCKADVHETWIERTRNTPQQVGLSEKEREENVRGAFRAAPQVMGQNIVLVDDVLTTAATAREAARVLKEAGAQTVRLAVVARAGRSTH